MSASANKPFMFFELADPFYSLELVSLHGTEALSELFEFRVELISEDADIEFDDVVGESCVITIGSLPGQSDGFDEPVPRYIHGIVANFEIADTGDKYTTYYAQIVPKVWPLSLRTNSRIFTKVTVQDMVTTLLDELGLTSEEYRWEANNSGKEQLDYCVQYKESELNFVCRLLEREGIYFYFEHNSEKHIVVFADDSTGAPQNNKEGNTDSSENQPALFNPRAKGMSGAQHIYQFNYSKQLAPGKVTLRDFNFKRPAQKLESYIDQKDDENRENYLFPAKFESPEQGERYANIKLQALNRYRFKGQGKSNLNALIPGFRFEFEDEQREHLNGSYLLTRIVHTAHQSAVNQEYATNAAGQSPYYNEFRCIPLAKPYRPPAQARIPVVEGAQTAIVVGPEGDEIYTDEYGRVKVRFHWDRRNDTRSESYCWVRVSQMWAGGQYGGFSLPRVGQEVIVDFMEGDPDRPIITGRVHHVNNPTPYALPENKTISTLKTSSSKGGEGFNELRFEDKKGEEQLFIHAEKNKDERVKNDALQWVGRNAHQVVENHQYTEIKKDRHHIVRGDANSHFEGDVNHILDASLHQHTKQNENYIIDGDRKTQISQAENITVGTDYNLSVSSDLGAKTGGSVHIKSGMTINLQAGSSINLKAGGSFISIGPSGVHISGSKVYINSGGSAKSASPATPAEAQKPEITRQALAADMANPGRPESIVINEPPVKPDTYSPQAKAMLYAAQNGTPFVEPCGNKEA